ncbi:Nif3-like dinuclear metal center hexameric protein [Methylovorus menthalis]|uniref:Nif3-like dinuclear metal center hexameric protein n=1 Tax=Methylovorus menthalis TaxID=1002227 RepID=UPI001E44172E|nr:Nif3-like dinuclear metal center hexameric protein [Methylovorus menthalis]MCB4810812.1 Nif3-like dinuclear metal center hexameric protein [Methylovorus menthalis]
MKLNELLDYTGQILQVARFKDYCPNGLQVEGKEEVERVVTGVTASLSLLEAARERGADLVMVHHGYFWRNEDARIVGIKQKRIKLLLESGMSLAAYHLPLDAHPELGNNAQLGKKLGLVQDGWAGEQDIIAYGRTIASVTAQDFSQHVSGVLNREALMLGSADKTISRVAWCTGGAQGYMEQAIALGVDAYISGEVSEQNLHLANEAGVVYIAAGHHATERYGVQALGEHLKNRFNVQHEYIEINNPV